MSIIIAVQTVSNSDLVAQEIRNFDVRRSILFRRNTETKMMAKTSEWSRRNERTSLRTYAFVVLRKREMP